MFVQAYNTKLVPRADLPKTYGDLLQPRWKGRIAIEGKEQEWFYTLVQSMGEAEGLKYFRALVAKGHRPSQVARALGIGWDGDDD